MNSLKIKEKKKKEAVVIPKAPANQSFFDMGVEIISMLTQIKKKKTFTNVWKCIACNKINVYFIFTE